MKAWSRHLALSLALSLGVIGSLGADEISDLFETPTQEAGTTAGVQATTVLEDYTKSQPKVNVAFDLYAAGGAYLGYTSYPNTSDLSAGFNHSSLGAIYLYSHLDLRPFDYLRVYTTAYTSYPSFGLTISEFYVDYGGPWRLATKLGKYSLAWGNARILPIADLPNRAIDTSDVADQSNVLPSWLKGNSPALWLKEALPLGPLTATFLMTLPESTSSGLSTLGYGMLCEMSLGKIYLSLGGYYRYNLTPRLSASIKGSMGGVDLFLDSTYSFPSSSEVLPSFSGGFYYQTKDGPNIKVTGELRWNGEKPKATALIQDAMAVGGLSQSLALSWTSFCGLPINVGGTWYHDWSDGSGAVVPTVSWDLGKLMSLKMVVPLVYGADGTAYRKNPPTEAYGFLEGIGIVAVIKTNF